jgi:hypothetical protein
VNPRAHDPELRDLISASDTLHEQLARLDRSEPPEELDRIVIERARQAIRMPQSDRPIRQLRWAVPLALAATLLISFALVLHQVVPQQPAAQPPTAATPQRPADAYAPVAAQARVEDARADEAGESRPKAREEFQESKTQPVGAVSATTRQGTTPAAGPTPAASRAAESGESATAARVAPSAALAKRENLEREALEGVTVTGSSAGEDNANSGLRADPDAWMAYIGRLRHAGRSEEADREYAEFRQVYPHYKYAAPTPAERPAATIAPEK